MPTRKTSSKTASRKTTKKAPAKSKASTAASPKKKAPPKKKATKKVSKKTTAKASDDEVTIDRRRKGRRAETAEAPETQPTLERRAKVSRRRQIDPTTCERDYSEQEVEFMSALDDYKRKSGRMFPTCSEVLEVIRNLGYVQLSPVELAAHAAKNDDSNSVSATSEWSPADEESADEGDDFSNANLEANAELVG